MDGIRWRSAAVDRLLAAMLLSLLLWMCLKTAGYYAPIGAEQLGLERFSDLRIRRLDDARWWVPMHFAATAAIIVYGLALFQRALPIARHHRPIAICGLVWSSVMALNLDHALGMPMHEDVVVGGVLTLTGLLLSILLLQVPSNALAYGLIAVIALSDVVANAWLLLWATDGALPSQIPVHLDQILNQAIDT